MHVEECEGWWWSGGRSLVAVHWQLKLGGSQRLPAFRCLFHVSSAPVMF